MAILLQDQRPATPHLPKTSREPPCPQTGTYEVLIVFMKVFTVSFPDAKINKSSSAHGQVHNQLVEDAKDNGPQKVRLSNGVKSEGKLNPN